MSGVRCVYAQVFMQPYKRSLSYLSLSLSSCKVLPAMATYIYDAYTHIYTHIYVQAST